MSKIKLKIISLSSLIKGALGGLRYIIKEFLAFSILIWLYVINAAFLTRLTKIKFLPRKFTNAAQIKFSKFYLFVDKKLESRTDISISKLDLIQLAIRNMKVKKTRTLITIGGVSIGIGAIVFLVSIGYGLKGLVLTRVARLDELRQADVSTQPGSRVKIDDKTVADVKALPNVVDVYPLIAVVGRVNYQGSISDMAVFGVTSGYLESSAIKPVKGTLFDSDALSYQMSSGDFDTPDSASADGDVAGASTSKEVGSIGDKLTEVEFNIYPDEWLRLRDSPSVNGKILGYTKRAEGKQYGDVVWGSSYTSDTNVGSYGLDENGVTLGKWMRSKVLVWEMEPCDSHDDDCIDGTYSPLKDDMGNQVQKVAYFAQLNIAVNATFNNTSSVLGDSIERMPEVLAETTGSAPITDQITVTESSDPNSAWVEIPEESGTGAIDEVKKVNLSSSALKKAVVNRAMLKLINLNEDDAVGKTFSTSFVIPTDLLESSKERVESVNEDYEIVGVTPDDNSPIFYVPFADLRSLGIVNFSQFKVLSKDKGDLPKIREQVGALGYLTQSVQDTVEQINSLFDTIVLVLGTMGMIALAVAALGMFNTLTVSLLERTREVGLMKAMGMKTGEVQELFLTESMIMGFCAGFLGLFIGFVFGKTLSLLLTVFAVFKGQGFIDVSYIPFNFVMLIMILSLLVGLLTGIFPARRSKKISALDALRYE